MTIKNVYDHYIKSLQPVYEKGEAESITQWIFDDRLGINKSDIFLKGAETIAEVKANDLAWKLMRLIKGEPVQYVLGYTFFYGLKLKINKSVLIPRPETEELVEWIIQEYKNWNHQEELKILDIGTGSGCIAIALKKNLPFAQVSALDISADALKIAGENAELNSTIIEFMQHDILKAATNFGSQFNLIVSNPPYVLENEKTKLHNNVLHFEPHQALFVPDNDPLIFNNSIADFAQTNLVEKGAIYLEINREYSEQAASLLHTKGFTKTKVRKDMSGNERMIKASR